MSDSTLEEEVASYLQSPVSGERLPVEVHLSVGLVGLLHKLAAERAVPTNALIEFFLFKQIRADQARRLVDEPLDPVPSSFSNDEVARARQEVEAAIENVKAQVEQRGDKATRIAADLESVLETMKNVDVELDDLRRRTALNDAMLDLALEQRRDKDED